MTASLPCNVWGAKHPVPCEIIVPEIIVCRRQAAMVGTEGSDPSLNGGVNRLSATHSHKEHPKALRIKRKIICQFI